MNRSPLVSPTRRDALAAGAGLLLISVARPARAEAEDLASAIRAFTKNATVTPGKVKLDLPPLVENGNSVSLSVSVDHPMTPQSHVRSIAIFNEKNPQPNVANFLLGPRCGRADVSTRIRLATTQTITAIAELSDGSFWSDQVEVIVTIAACTEE